MKKILSFLAVMAFFTLNGLYAQTKLDKKELLRIGNEKVSVKEFMDVYTKNNMPQEGVDKTPIDEYLDLYVNFRLKVKEAIALEMDTVSSFRRELEGYRKQLAKPYFVDEKVSEALLEEAYQHKLQDVRASHILLMLDKNAPPSDTLEVWNKAMEVRARALKGEDFSALAVEFSDDPSAKDRPAIPNQQGFRPGNKGDLGYFSAFDMIYPFEIAAYNTPVGEISKPVRSDFGYHLIKVDERTEASGLIEAAHIYVTVDPDAPQEQIDEKQEKINFIHSKIQEGMSFEDAVEEYSEDRGSAQREGRLSRFSVNRIVPEFVAEVKKMRIGEVSAPVRTIYGFHIIKLIGMTKPGSFEEEAPKLKEKLAKDVRSQKSEEAVIEQIKKDYKFKTNDNNLRNFLESLDESLTNAEFNEEAYLGNKTTLFTIAKEAYSVEDFAAFITEKQSAQRNTPPATYGYKLFKQFADESCIAYEEDRLEQKFPEFAGLMKEYHDGILLFDLMDQEVWSKAVKDTTGLKEFHNANKSNYMWGKRAVASIYTITSEEQLARIRILLENMNDDEKIRQSLESDNIQGVRIQMGKFEEGANKFVDATGWQLGLGDAVYADADKHVIIVRIREVLPPQPKELEEARGIITSDYQNELERVWIEELRAKYPVKLDNKVYNKLKTITN